jgi:ABC-type dipeptide/oligopeptide/nickel transport system permease subunit
MGVGLIATMSALVLGLLIASAKSTYDTKANEVNQITADIVMIDQFARRIRTRG